MSPYCSSSDGKASAIDQPALKNDPILAHVVPNALALLTKLNKQLSATPEPSKPLINDALYFAIWESLFDIHCNLRILHLRLSVELSKPWPADGCRSQMCLPPLASSLQNLSKLLSSSLQTLVDKSPLKPRIVRLADRLKLSAAELRAFIWVIFFCSGRHGAGEEAGWFRGRTVLARLAEWSQFESVAHMLTFLSPTREHFKCGLIDFEDEYASNYSEVTFRVPREVMKALYGATLHAEEALTFASTPLAEVLEEEPGAVLKEGSVEEHPHIQDNVKVNGEKPRALFPQDAQRVLNGGADAPFVEQLRFLKLEELAIRARGMSSNGAPEIRTKDENMNGESYNDGMLETEQAKNANVDEEDRTKKNGDSLDDGEAKIQRFANDLEYLQEGFEVVLARLRIFNVNEKEEDPYVANQRTRETLLRELEAKERQALSKFNRRLELTCSQSEKPWSPRLERLAKKLGLNAFERFVILAVVGVILSQAINRAFRAIPRYPANTFDIGMLLRMHCSTLEEQIRCRKYFYPDSSLVASGIIRLVEPISRMRKDPLTDLAVILVEIDRRMLDYLCGLDTELDELISSVRCYRPSENIDSVILPEKTKKLVVQAAENFDTFKRFRKEVGFDDIVRYGKGLIMLFYGEPGTGKTLFANALANHLRKKVLSVRFTSLEDSSIEADSFRVLFREAAIQDAIVFFDECDALFVGGGARRYSVTVALREMENFDGIMILATTRPYDLDHAMHRRISLAIELNAPDPVLRQKIWIRHIPPRLKMSKDVNCAELAIEHELTGGFIKNAILQAMSMAIAKARENKNKKGKDTFDVKDMKIDDVEVTMDMLRKACRLQARGRLRMKDLERRVVPNRGFDDLIVSEEVMTQLKDCVMCEKVRRVLSTQWGFKDGENGDRANVMLLYGPSGCGKSTAASALGFEIGRPLQKLSASEILRRSSQDNHDIFSDAMLSGAVVVIEQAELIFASLVQFESSSANEIMYHVASYPGLVVLCCTTAPALSSGSGWPTYEPFPELVLRTARYVVSIPSPNMSARLRLWDSLIPKETPLDKDVRQKLKNIAEDYKFNGATISSCVRRAAARAALRGAKKSQQNSSKKEDVEPSSSSSDASEGECEESIVTVDDIVISCKAELVLKKLADKGLTDMAFV